MSDSPSRQNAEYEPVEPHYPCCMPIKSGVDVNGPNIPCPSVIQTVDVRLIEKAQNTCPEDSQLPLAGLIWAVSSPGPEA